METPNIIIPVIIIAILLASLKRRNHGTKLSTNNINPKTVTMAMKAATKPLMTAFILSGLVIKPLVAPTICMVFIKNRLLYIAKRIVLSIDIMTIMERIIANTNMPAAMYLV